MCFGSQRITKERKTRVRKRTSTPLAPLGPPKRSHFREREKLSNEGKYGKKQKYIAASWVEDMRTCAVETARKGWEKRKPDRAMKMYTSTRFLQQPHTGRAAAASAASRPRQTRAPYVDSRNCT